MFACIFIPDFPAQALIRVEPELRAHPVAVLAGRPPLERVVSLNQRAREIGVDAGATKPQLEAWENLELRDRSEAHENSAQAVLLDCAQSFSPEVEDTSPGAVLLNLAGLEPLLGPLPKIADALAQRVSQMGLEANLAVAVNPDAALLAARGFSGLTLISQYQEAIKLGGLPVDVLLESFFSDIAEATRWIEIFDRWGIRKLRALAALPEVAVSERLGQQGLHLQKLARGGVSRNLRELEPPPIFAEHEELEYPIVLLEPLAFLLNRMLEQLCARLQERALAVQELRLTLELVTAPTEDCAPATQKSNRAFTRALRLPTPMLNTRVFLKLLQLDLQANPPGAPIVKIHLSAEPARPRALQSGLFQPLFPEPEKLELTLARIAGIVGEGRSGSVELLDTHREGAFAMQHFAPAELAAIDPKVQRSGKKKIKERNKDEENMSTHEHGSACEPREQPAQNTKEETREDAAEKMSAVIAMRLFRPPLAASVSLREAKPVRMQCLEREDVSGEIVWTAGPWRSSGDWSEHEGWSREEWDIAIPAGSGLALYRLVQDKVGRKWFVEGMYD